MDVIFTIVSRNYAAQAATLMESLATAEPQARRVVVAADGPIPELSGKAEVIPAQDLGAPVRDMSVYYEALELNTAVKPFAFRSLLKQPGVSSVTYLDPDIFVYRPLDAVREGLRQAQLCLTPHITRPLLGPASPNDQDLLRAGIYNLGFVSARNDPKVFDLLDWWAERCRFDCRVDLANGLFTDQKWMDLSPGLVDSVAILRDCGLNLAYWNLEGRRVERGPQGWTVDGQPLCFFHFSGFDPARPKTLSKHQNRLEVEPGSDLAELLADFAKAMLKNGHAQTSPIPYAFQAFASGRPVTRPMRLRALRAARGGETFPDGLGAATEAWLDGAESEAVTPGLTDITRLMDQVWRDSVAADHFDRATEDGRDGFRRWFADNAPALGADALAVSAGQALATERGGGREADGHVWRETPFAGPSSEVAVWLREDTTASPRACLALLAARKDLRQRFARDPQALLAWCIGPEAQGGRFSLNFLPPLVVDALAADSALLFQAARFADSAPAGSDLRRRLQPGFGVGHRAGWPTELTGPLRKPHLAPADGLPPPYVRLFADIWSARPDLQRLYPLARASGRLRFLRWLIAGGLAEYGVDLAALPERVRHHPQMRVAELSVRRKAQPPLTGRASGKVPRLIVVETLEGRVSGPTYEAGQARFHNPGHAPAHVDLVIFRNDPASAPADAIALLSQGVRWDRAVGEWDADAVAALDDETPALSFIDEVWTVGEAARDDLPRPVRAMPAAA